MFTTQSSTVWIYKLCAHTDVLFLRLTHFLSLMSDACKSFNIYKMTSNKHVCFSTHFLYFLFSFLPFFLSADWLMSSESPGMSSCSPFSIFRLVFPAFTSAGCIYPISILRCLYFVCLFYLFVCLCSSGDETYQDIFQDFSQMASDDPDKLHRFW